ncbi:phage portal protein [Vagococcus intermedius]|uniref:Phage portal protein n=1 Tax=Vagococcus intermedius TaxID=2991418 RepID=A0AAF0CX40_9ENTE|nr:phage portal protein [Vagococcus intermedius]WEG74403.1 phage portal protein [Vagococcus intermedius]WEG76524.1 phage portal protein [Vagococcus intermedius]
MAIKMDRELAGDVNKPSAEVLAYCIAEHLKEVDRLNNLSDYYDGKHEILTRKKESSKELTNVMINNAKYVTDLNVGFTFGNPIAYTPGKENNIEEVIEVFDEIGIKKHDRELGKDLSVFGIGHELHYLSLHKDKIVPKIACIDPRGIFLVTDDTVDSNSLFAVRYIEKFDLKSESIGYHVEVYTENWVIVYKVKDLEFKQYEVLKASQHYYNAVPVIEFRNNEEKQGDWEQAISLMNAYNVLQSDRINDKEAFIDAILVLYGFSLEEDDGNQGGGDIVINAPSKADGADVGYLTKTFSESDVQVLSKSIEKDIHKVTYTPNLNDESFAGTISGEAMKYKLFGLLQLLVTKTGYFEDGVRQRLELMENVLTVQGKHVDVSGTKINFKPNLPINKKEIVEMIRDSQEFIPLLVSLGWLDDIDDPKEVIDMLQEQKEQAVELNKKAIGDSSPSFNYQDHEPEDNE